MKIRILAVSVALTGVNIAWGAMNEPFKPRSAAKVTNPALVKLEAVDTVGRLQLGKKFTGDENTKIVAFLKTLAGEQPNFKLPMLPPSSDMTPKPQPFAQK